MKAVSLLAVVLCAGSLAACSSPSSDITAAANDVTRLLDKAGHARLSDAEAKTFRDDLQTLVADQAGEDALVATGALKTAGQQAAADLAAGLRTAGDRRRQRAVRAAVCREAFDVDTLPAGARAPMSDPAVAALVARAEQLRGGTQSPEAYLGALTDALCRA